MRKQIAAARRFIFEIVAERFGVNRDQQQIFLPGEVFRRSFRKLAGGREMDVSVSDIDRRAFKNAVFFGCAPKLPGNDLVYGLAHGCVVFCSAFSETVYRLCAGLESKSMRRRWRRTGFPGILCIITVWRQSGVIIQFWLQRERIMVRICLAAFMSLSILGSAYGQEGRFVFESNDDGYVRFDTKTGEISICRVVNDQAVCRMAADERKALEEQIELLQERVDALQTELAASESGGHGGFPSEEDLDRTMGFVENMFRRFNDLVDDLEADRTDPPPAAGERE